MSSLFDCKEIKTYNHLVRNRTLSHFAKLDVVLLFIGNFEQISNLGLVSIVDFEQANTDGVTFITKCHTIQLRIFLKDSLFLSCRVIYGQLVYFTGMTSVL